MAKSPRTIAMNSYFSLVFLGAFLPATVLAYGIAPRRVRWVVLLAASYAFFWCLSGKLVICLAASTLSVYACGLALGVQHKRREARLAHAESGKRALRAASKRRMRLVLFLGIAFNIGLLVVFKYLGFFGGSAASLLGLLGIETSFALPSFGIPIGISFYTLMAMSYLVDVYRESAKADRHLGRVALYLCFFPHIMEGPICRYGQTAYALTEGDPLRRASMYEGTVRILYGLAKKIIVADRLNAFVKPVFDNYGSYDGGIIALAAVLYTVQLYCDFSGTMDVALGIGRIFNTKLPENFRQPFFSRTASEFWQRWHITLGAWFKDYVYYPVSLSTPCKRLTSKARKRLGSRYGPLLAGSVALLCVWVGNGLWHGAGGQYLFFGMYYFVLITLGGLIEPAASHLTQRLGIDRERVWYRAFQVSRTLVIVFVGELFFRANGLNAGLSMFGQILTEFTLDSFFDGSIIAVGMGRGDYLIVTLFSLVMLAVGAAKERGTDALLALGRRGAVVRWSVAIALFMAIVIFGAYGTGYTPVDPMYAQF